MGHFNGENNDDTNWRLVDTRTRLYYTAKINDNLKFVNKFEYNAVFGGIGTYGQPGADTNTVLIKNSYADFNLGPVNVTVGAQPYALFRSFYIDDDGSGIIARWKVLDNFVLAGSWLKNYEGGAGTGNNEDVDTYTLTGAFWFSENISIKPSISYARSSQLNTLVGLGLLANVPGTALTVPPWGQVDLYTYGFDFDASFDNFGIWATLIGQDGTVDQNLPGVSDLDISNWLGAIGGNVGFDMFDIHGQFFYTPGDDNPNDFDIETFFCPNGSYYWSEIMGLGIFDNTNPVNTPGDKIQNVWAVNLGTTIKPMDKLKVTVDLWYAQLEEDIVFNAGTPLQRSEDDLGTELDVVVTYQLVEGLNLDLVGAYLWAGDAVSLDGNNNEDPYEFGARLSLSF
jgi:hypothetical protein